MGLQRLGEELLEFRHCFVHEHWKKGENWRGDQAIGCWNEEQKGME